MARDTNFEKGQNDKRIIDIRWDPIIAWRRICVPKINVEALPAHAHTNKYAPNTEHASVLYWTARRYKYHIINVQLLAFIDGIDESERAQIKKKHTKS